MTFRIQRIRDVPMEPNLLIIVPCGKHKIWENDPGRGATPAREAYTSPTFTANRAFAERHGDAWLILSAKYGFISPGFLIPQSYDVTFYRPETAPISYQALTAQVRNQNLGRFRRVICLGDRAYCDAVTAAFSGTDARLEFPLLHSESAEAGIAFLETYVP